MTEKIEQLAGQTTKIEADLQKYLDFIKEPQLTEAERRDFQEKLEQWNQAGNVEQIRTAGVDQEINKNDYLKRHQLLSSEFLTKSIIDKGVKLNINFKNNNLAEWRVGLADMLPPNVKRVKLTRADGTEVIGVRAQNPKTKRIGYYEEIALKEGNYDYMACHTGDSCEPLETYEIPNSNLGDLTTYAEHIQVYTNGAAKEESSDPEEKKYYNPETDAGKTAEEIKDTRVSTLVELAQQERQRISQEVAPSSNETEAAIRKKIVDAAEKRANKFDPAFRTSDVAGGSLACAKVVTTILIEAGFLDKINLGVDNTVAILREKGWQQSTEKAQPGDVVVWDVLPGGKHKHIGVAISKTEAVNNKNAEKMPVASSIYDYRVGNNLRPVLFVLKPPIPKAVKNTRQPQHQPQPQPQQTETLNESNDTTRGQKGEQLIKNQQFRNRLKQVAANIGCMPEDLVAIFDFESKGINPQEQNEHKATGLIQWMPRTAREMYHLDVSQIRAMTGLQQLDLVESYFKRSGPNKNIDDLYLSVLYPVAKNKSDDFIMGLQGGMQQAQSFANHNPFNGWIEKPNKAYLVRKADVLKRIRKVRATSRYIKLYQRLENNS